MWTQIPSSTIEPVFVILGTTFRGAMPLLHVAGLNHGSHEVVLLDESPRRESFRPRKQSAGVTVVADCRPFCPRPNIPGKMNRDPKFLRNL